MAYLQKFGINRNTPMNMVAPMKMVGGEDNQASNVVEKQNKKAVETACVDAKKPSYNDTQCYNGNHVIMQKKRNPYSV